MLTLSFFNVLAFTIFLLWCKGMEIRRQGIGNT